jgi:hypothetical protein
MNKIKIITNKIYSQKQECLEDFNRLLDSEEHHHKQEVPVDKL